MYYRLVFVGVFVLLVSGCQSTPNKATHFTPIKKIAQTIPNPITMQKFLSPMASAQQVLAAKTSTFGEVLKLVFERKRGSSLEELQILPILELEIGDTYLAINEGSQKTVYDSELSRILAIDTEDKSFLNSSLHGLVTFKGKELVHRIKMDKEARKTADQNPKISYSPDPQVTGNTWSEIELGLRLPEHLPDTAISISDDVLGITATYNGEQISKIKFSDITASSMEANGLTRYFRYLGGLHPLLLDQLQNRRFFPNVIEYTDTKAHKRRYTKLRLVSSERINARYPLPKDWVPKLSLSPRGTALANFANNLKKLYANPSGKTLEDVNREQLERMSMAVRNGLFADAYLTVLERNSMNLAKNDCAHNSKNHVHCQMFVNIISRINSDPDIRRLNTGLIADSKGRWNVALQIWKPLDLKIGFNTHVFALKKANATVKHLNSNSMWNPEKKEKLVSSAISHFNQAAQGNPENAQVCHDAAQLFRYFFDTFTEWDLYDLCRNLPTRNPPDLLSRITRWEKELPAKFSEFY
jgi:hypothetical protein